MIALTHEYRVRTDAELHVQVAARAAPRPRLAPAVHPQSRPVLDAGGDRDLHGVVGRHTAAAGARDTRRGGDVAGPLAVRARATRHDLAEDRPLHGPLLSGSAAASAPRAERSRLAFTSFASLTGVQDIDRNGLRRAEDRLGEVELEMKRKIRPAGRPAGARARPRAAERRAEEALHDVAQIAEPGEPGSGARVAVHVVALALHRI